MKSRKQLIKDAVALARAGTTCLRQSVQTHIYPNSSGQFGSTIKDIDDPRIQYKVEVWGLDVEYIREAAAMIAQDPRVEKAYVTPSHFIRVNFHQSYAAEQADLR